MCWVGTVGNGDYFWRWRRRWLVDDDTVVMKITIVRHNHTNTVHGVSVPSTSHRIVYDSYRPIDPPILKITRPQGYGRYRGIWMCRDTIPTNDCIHRPRIQSDAHSPHRHWHDWVPFVYDVVYVYMDRSRIDATYSEMRYRSNQIIEINIGVVRSYLVRTTMTTTPNPKESYHGNNSIVNKSR
jgi:hypothetical protein